MTNVFFLGIDTEKRDHLNLCIIYWIYQIRAFAKGHIVFKTVLFFQKRVLPISFLKYIQTEVGTKFLGPSARCSSFRMNWNWLRTWSKLWWSNLRNIIISLSTMVLKTLILIICNPNTLMQPKNKKRKVTIMSNYSWINRFKV